MNGARVKALLAEIRGLVASRGDRRDAENLRMLEEEIGKVLASTDGAKGSHA